MAQEGLDWFSGTSLRHVYMSVPAYMSVWTYYYPDTFVPAILQYKTSLVCVYAHLSPITNFIKLLEPLELCHLMGVKRWFFNNAVMRKNIFDRT